MHYTLILAFHNAEYGSDRPPHPTLGPGPLGTGPGALLRNSWPGKRKVDARTWRRIRCAWAGIDRERDGDRPEGNLSGAVTRRARPGETRWTRRKEAVLEGDHPRTEHLGHDWFRCLRGDRYKIHLDGAAPSWCHGALPDRPYPRFPWIFEARQDAVYESVPFWARSGAPVPPTCPLLGSQPLHPKAHMSHACFSLSNKKQKLRRSWAHPFPRLNDRTENGLYRLPRRSPPPGGLTQCVG